MRQAPTIFKELLFFARHHMESYSFLLQLPNCKKRKVGGPESWCMKVAKVSQCECESGMTHVQSSEL